MFTGCKKCYECTMSKKTSTNKPAGNNILLPENSTTKTTVCNKNNSEIKQMEKAGTHSTTTKQVINNETYDITVSQTFSCR